MAIVGPQILGIFNGTGGTQGNAPHPQGDTIHFEACGSASTVAGVVNIQGSISGQNWATINSLTFTSGTGNVAQFYSSSAVRFNFYRANVTGLSGGSMQVWIGN